MAAANDGGSGDYLEISGSSRNSIGVMVTPSEGDF